MADLSERQPAFKAKDSQKRGKGRPFVKGVSGNPKGGPKKGESQAELLVAALTKKEKKPGDFWKHVITRAYKSDTILIAVMKKLVSDKRELEIEPGESFKELLSAAVARNEESD